MLFDDKRKLWFARNLHVGIDIVKQTSVKGVKSTYNIPMKKRSHFA